MDPRFQRMDKRRKIKAAMAFKVFLSYGTDPDEQVAAWRLQTLATSYGMHVSVPHRNGSGKAVANQVRKNIDQSDCVLAIITGNIGPAVAQELNYALAKGKLIVPVVRQGINVPPALKGLRLFQFSPWNTGEAEAEVVKFLHDQKYGKEKQQTIGALVAIGLGLFLLAALSNKQ
jgi:TIR domain